MKLMQKVIGDYRTNMEHVCQKYEDLDIFFMNQQIIENYDSSTFFSYLLKFMFPISTYGVIYKGN